VTHWFVHIGQMKTATTALQRGLALGADRLLDVGVLYPQTGRFDDRHAQLAWATWAKVAPLKGWAARHASELPIEELVAQLQDEVAVAGVESVVISSEELSLRPASVAGPLLEPLGGRVTIIVYLRPQGEMLEAMYRQQVKGMGITDRFEDFAHEQLEGDTDLVRRLRYRDLLGEWSEAFPHAALIPQVFDDARRVGILRHFLEAVGAADPGLGEAPIANVSFQEPVLEMVRRANDYLPPAVRSRFLSDAQWLQHELALASRSLLSPELALEVSTRFEEQNRAVARDYFDKDLLFEAART
jgi:hypothetical protein